MSAHRLYAASKRKREVFRERVILMVIVAAVVVFGSIIVGTRLVSAYGNAQESPIEYKYYKSMEINSGDTLWEIAAQHTDGSYKAIINYIEELKDINGLTSDEIHEGQYLAVAYYSTEFME